MGTSRSRTRLGSHARVLSYVYDKPGETNRYSTFSSKADYALSVISDIVGGRGSKPVSHVRTEISPFGCSMPRGLQPSDGWYQTLSDSNFWVGGMPAFPGVPSASGWDALHEQLLLDASGAMPLQANLVVNAAELASLRELLPQACNIARQVVRSKFGRKSLKELANGHLLYSFGVKPLITDIKGILAVRQNVKRRIAELERRSNRSVRITVRGPVSTGTLSTTYARGTASTGRRVTCNTTWEWSEQLCLSASVTSFFVNDASSQIKLWSSALGLSSPLSSIWELIPFSFVADWLLPIGDQFAKVERKLGLHETVRNHSLTDYVWSRKTTCKGRGSSVSTSTFVPSWNGLKHSYGGLSQTTYSRGSGIPASALVPPIGWSVNRTALSISLILQKIMK